VEQIILKLLLGSLILEFHIIKTVATMLLPIVLSISSPIDGVQAGSWRSHAGLQNVIMCPQEDLFAVWLVRASTSPSATAILPGCKFQTPAIGSKGITMRKTSLGPSSVSPKSEPLPGPQRQRRPTSEEEAIELVMGCMATEDGMGVDAAM
jgi:hypothetical protein